MIDGKWLQISGLYERGYDMYFKENNDMDINGQINSLSYHLKLNDDDNKKRQEIVQKID